MKRRVLIEGKLPGTVLTLDEERQLAQVLVDGDALPVWLALSLLTQIETDAALRELGEAA